MVLRRLLLVLAVALTVGGCGTAEPAAQSPASKPAAAAPSSAPTAWTMAQARSRYKAIVAPYNAALETFEDAAHAQTPWRQLRPLAGDVAQAGVVHAKALRAGRWPPSVRTPVTELAAETDRAARAWRTAAEAGTAAELADAVHEAVRHDGSKQAGRIRDLLGLKPYAES